MKKIWIDITNSPHVLFFRPLITELKNRGYDVAVTTREFAQTVPLLESFGIEYTKIGSHRGKSKIKKAIGMYLRVNALKRWAKRKHFDLALGHASNDVAVAAKYLNIKQITMFDYEYAVLSHKINLPRVDKCLVPKWLPDEVLVRYAIKKENIMKYNGLKEKVYLWDFIPEKDILSKIGIQESQKKIVTFRPPATMAA